MKGSESAAGRWLVGACLGLALAWLVASRSGVVGALARPLAAAAHPGPQRTVLRVWDWWSPATDEKYGRYFGEVKREFERLHPEVEVAIQYVPFGEYEQKMATAMSGGSPPDVFQSSVAWAEGFYNRGMLLPLNRYLARDRAERYRRQALGLPVDTTQIVDREAFLESAWRHNTTVDGTVYGIPEILDADCLVWNLDLMRKAAANDAEIAGLFEREPGGRIDWDRLRFDCVGSWPQFRRIARKLTRYGPDGRILLDAAGNHVQAGFAIHAHGSGSGPFMPWCSANGGRFQDAAGTRCLFAETPGVEAMQFLLDLYWKDHVSPPFRRQISDDELFNEGHVACAQNGTWAGKYITRATEGRLRFDLTPFPPGPHGDGPATEAWGNMLAIARGSAHVDLAWEYVKFITCREGSLRLLRNIEANSPRKDFYLTPAWEQACVVHPYLHNVPAICSCGKKRRSTEANAVEYVTEPFFETLMLRYPDIAAGRGPYPSVQAGLQAAASAVDRVYGRYNAQLAEWRR